MSHRVRAAPGANKVKSAFCGGVYVAKYTLRGESVFLRAARKMRGSERIPFAKKGRRPFLTKLR